LRALQNALHAFHRFGAAMVWCGAVVVGHHRWCWC
jgi:hypothetical protein